MYEKSPIYQTKIRNGASEVMQYKQIEAIKLLITLLSAIFWASSFFCMLRSNRPFGGSTWALATAARSLARR